jgi:hypothetical protein
MVKDIGSATVIAPMIKDYIDVGVKNDDQLVKLSAVLTRFINGTSSSSDEVGGSGMLTDIEKEELLNNVKKELNDLEEKSASIDKQIKQSKDGIQ